VSWPTLVGDHIDANFKGWKQFHPSRKDFTPEGTWDGIQFVTFHYTNGGPAPEEPEGLVFADIRFLPASGAEADLEIKKDEAGSFRTWNYMPE